VIIKTANVGDIDNITHVVDIEVNTEPINNYSNRLSGKYYKTHHIQDSIWIDSSFSIKNKDFSKIIEDMLGDYDFMITRHPERKTLKEEYDYILKHLNDPYLKVRYGDEDWKTEIEAFSDGFDAPLLNPAFFALRKEKTDKLMSDWWDLILKYTIFDQSQLTYLLHKNTDLKVKYINWNELRPYVNCIGHKKII
jgi:hypothetical protein